MTTKHPATSSSQTGAPGTGRIQAVRGRTGDAGAIRVLCVEEDPMARRCLTARLGGEPDLELVGAAPSMGAALWSLMQVPVDVVLLDPGLPDGVGAVVLEALARRFPDPSQRPQALVFTGAADSRTFALARTHGAAGVVAKERLSQELVPALRSVAAGGTWLAPA